jgi:hypothetical protein
MPHWVVVLLLLGGFTLAMVLAWRYGRAPLKGGAGEGLPDYSELRAMRDDWSNHRDSGTGN